MPTNHINQGISITPTPAPIHEIVDPTAILPLPEWLIALILIFFLAILASLIFWLARRPKKQPELTPQAKAIAALVALQSETLSAYEFALRISSILRTYLEEAYGLRAVTATSLEFLESIRDNSQFSSDERASLREFLELADLIKFARAEATPEDLSKLFQAAENVVRKPLLTLNRSVEASTKPPPIPSSAPTP